VSARDCDAAALAPLWLLRRGQHMGVMERWRKGTSSSAVAVGAPPEPPAEQAKEPSFSTPWNGTGGRTPEGTGAPASSRHMAGQPVSPVPEETASADGSRGDSASHGVFDLSPEHASSASGMDTAPVVIQADAPLVDGLRALLVHHLKRSVGTSVVNLSASQAELLEHHLARLSSYAQKIVHTLAFATRFLCKQQLDGQSPELDGGSSPRAEGGRETRPAALSHGDAWGQSGRIPASSSAEAAAGNAATAAAEASRPGKKPLKLSDDEIMNLYRSAQAEAAIEADWRGIPGPTASRGGASGGAGGGTGEGGACSSRSGGSGYAASGGLPDGEANEGSGTNRADYLRILSRAMQEPGRSPRAVAAEIADPTKKTVCCGRPPAVLDFGRSQPPEALAARVGARGSP
jgi:hypothetical protein